jgi:hypothetical protein
LRQEFDAPWKFAEGLTSFKLGATYVSTLDNLLGVFCESQE